jgi:hypothetical protein
MLKTENLISKFDTNTLPYTYFSEVIKEIKNLYKSNNLTKIYSKCLDDLNVAYSILIVEYIKKELVKKEGNSGDGKNKGVVIDVTEE